MFTQLSGGLSRVWLDHRCHTHTLTYCRSDVFMPTLNACLKLYNMLLYIVYNMQKAYVLFTCFKKHTVLNYKLHMYNYNSVNWNI